MSAAIAQPALSIVNITGSGTQQGTAIAVDTQGNAYLAGFTDSALLTIPGLSPSPACPGGTNAFVIKFAAATNAPLWARCFGGSWDDRAYAIAIGPDGSVYVAGSTNSPDFPASGGSVRTTGGLDGFITKWSADGSSITWTVLIGGTSRDVINSIYVSSAGELYIGGETMSADLPMVNAVTSHLVGYQNGFLARLTSVGLVRYCTYVGGSGHDRVLAVSADAQGNEYATGSTDSIDFPAVNALISHRPGPQSGFVVKLRADGGQFIYSTYLGGSHGYLGMEQANTIAVSQAGVAYVGGVTSSSDFPTASAYQSVFHGWNNDAYLAAIAADGSKLLFSTFLGGWQSESIAGLSLNESSGVLTATGPTMSTDFPGFSAAVGSFVVQFSTTGQYQQTLQTLPAGMSAAGIAANASQTLFLAGTATGPNAFLAVSSAPVAAVTKRVLWMNDSTRQVKEWQMTGSQGITFGTSIWMNQSGMPGWSVVGFDDFNGDGVPDIVWQNDTTRQVSVTYMSGSQGNVISSSSMLTSNDMTGWRIAAIADFNGDGKPDLIWQNDASRRATIWYLTGAQGNVLLTWNWLVSTDMLGWKIVAAADFNGDGKPDLVWQNDSARQATLWYMGGVMGSQNTSWTWLTSNSMAGWRIAAVSDFNKDGKPDVVWQNDSSRQATVWFMSGSTGTTISNWTYLDAAGQTGWMLSGAR